MTTGSITTTTHDVFLPEVWIPKINDAREKSLVAVKAVWVWPEAQKGKADTFNIPNVTASTVTQKSTGITNTVTYETFTETKVTLSIDQHWYAAHAPEWRTKALAPYDFVAIYVKRAAYAVSEKQDATLTARFDGLSTNVVGILAEDLTDAHLRISRRMLNDANVPAEERSWLFSPAMIEGLLSIDRYMSMDFVAKGGISSGNLPNILYGAQVLETQNLEGSDAAGRDGALIHKEAFVAGYPLMSVRFNFDDIDTMATKFLVHGLWGDVENRDNHGVWVKGR